MPSPAGASAAVSPVGSGITGVLLDEADQPVAGTRVMACMTTVCLFGKTAADGRFAFDIDAPADIAIKTEGDPTATPRRAAALHPVRLAVGDRLDVGAVRAPALPPGKPVGPASQDPQTIEAGDGLVLTVARGALTPKLGDVLVDVAARHVAPRFHPRYAALAGEEVVAVYALHPFAAKSARPIAVQAPADLPDGAAVKFRTISEIDGTFSPAVAGRVRSGRVMTDPGEGIRELTHLVISRVS